MRFDYHHHVVRDLAWAIASPPLLEPVRQACRWYQPNWYREAFETTLPWFKRLDRNPEDLQTYLSEQKDRRLGKYFESLWAFWLRENPRFEIVKQNLPLRVDDKTLGELDLLVLDKTGGQLWHWELAVKFYLGAGNTRHLYNWHGPGKKDRFDSKVEHLAQRQSVICQQAPVQEILQSMGLRVDNCGVILKGRLYYPQKPDEKRPPLHASTGHLNSRWYSLQEFIKNTPDKMRINLLVGRGWMAHIENTPAEENDLLTLDKPALLAALENGDYRLPLHVAFQHGNIAVQRVFIVGDHWSDNL